MKTNLAVMRGLCVVAFLLGQKAAGSSEITLVTVTSGKARDAVKMLGGSGNWKADPKMQFVKLDLRLSAPVTITKVEVQSCGPSFADGADLYVNFDEQHAFSEGGKTLFTFLPGRNLPNVQARTLTFNFRYNKEVCVSAVRLFHGDKRVKYTIEGADEKASSNAAALYDSRLDTAWSPDETGGSAAVQFEAPTRVQQIRIWNGDQRSAAKFSAQPRVKTLSVIGDETKATVTVKDLKGMQTLELSNSVKGKVIRVAVEKAYEGEVKNARISELQLGAGDEYVSVDTSSAQKETADARREQFKKAGLEDVLDHNLVVNEEADKWAVRVRSDGTFFMRGQSENLNRARTFSFLGSYSVQESTKRGLRIRVTGSMGNPGHEQDSSMCGRDCAENPGPEALFITDEISFGRGKNGTVFVRDEGSRRAMGLKFHALKARIAKESQ